MKIKTYTVKQLVAEVATMAKDVIKEGGDLGACFAVLLPDTLPLLCPVKVGTPAEKDAMFEEMRVFMERLNAYAYCFVSELWMRRLEPGQFTKDGVPLDGIAPSQAADRVELLMIDGWDKNGVHEVFAAPITMTESGARTLGPPSDFSKLEMRGRATNLLFPKTVGGVQ